MLNGQAPTTSIGLISTWISLRNPSKPQRNFLSSQEHLAQQNALVVEHRRDRTRETMVRTDCRIDYGIRSPSWTDYRRDILISV